MSGSFSKQVLKEVILDQRAIGLPTPLVQRQYYTDIEQLKAAKQVVIICGLRRCGKSILLGQIRACSKEKDFFIHFDDDRLVQFQLEDFQMLYELFIELFGPQRTFYFDEIQNIIGWERFVRRLSDAGNKVYITGSNASMLSAELGTRLTGRYLEIHLYPYSFMEFLAYKGQLPEKVDQLNTLQRGALKSQWNDFLRLGGLPEYLESENPEYLHHLYQSILYRDIIVRHKISNERSIKELVYYLASHVGKELSYQGLSRLLGLSSTTTISNYCGYLQDSFLCDFVNRYDFSLKKQIQSPKKVYFIDQALAVNVGFRFSEDRGRLLENIVFLELKRRKGDIYFHKAKRECDFVLRQGLEIVSAVQVCVEMIDPEVENREIEGLLEAMETYDLHQGLIITENSHATLKKVYNQRTYEISVVPVWSWLLEKTEYVL